MKTKICSRCNQRKKTEAFGTNRRMKDSLQVWCKKCQKEYRKSNAEKISITQRNWRVLNPNYWNEWRTKQGYPPREIKKLSPEDVLKISGTECAICHQHPDRGLCIDHNHDTGKIRGTLCHSCNSGLGFFYDDPERLRLAIDYLAMS